MSHYLRNLTDSPAYNVELIDLGITIEVGVDYDTSEIDSGDLGNSIDLAAAVQAGELAFLDDTASPLVPLSITESEAIINASNNAATNILGTINFFPKWSNDCPCTLTESNMYQDPITGYIGVNLQGSPLTPAADFDITGALQLTGSSSGYTRFSVSASGDNVVYTLPSNDGDSNQVLQTDGTGTLTWVDQTVGSSMLDDLTDVTVTSIGPDEILVYQGSPAVWINQTLGEAGIAPIGHTHVMSDIVGATWISDITNEPIGDLVDVTITGVTAGEVFVYQGSPATWINQTLAEAGISAVGHTHTIDELSNTNITAVGAGEILVYQGSPAEWQNNTLAEAGISATGHTHTLGSLSDVADSASGSPVPIDGYVLTYDTVNGWQPQAYAGMGQGMVIQCIHGSVAAVSGTSSIPNDNTTPLVTEGYELWSDTITLNNVANHVEVTTSLTLDSYTGGGMGGGDMEVVITLFRDSTCIGAMSQYLNSYNQEQVHVTIHDEPASVSSLTYSCRIGRITSSGTWYVNRLETNKFNGMLAIQGYTMKELDHA